MISEPVVASTSHQSEFIQGMTLDRYLQLVSNRDEFKMEDEEEGQQKYEDLYATCKQVERSYSNKMINFCIKEMDQDHEEEETHFNSHNQKLPEQRQPYNQLNPKPDIAEDNPFTTTMYNFQLIQHPKCQPPKNNKKFRIKHQSNSPFKKELSPLKNSMTKTFGTSNGFLFNPNKIVQNQNVQNGTLYNKFLKFSQEKNKEKHFRKKNSDDLNNIYQYEKQLGNKYERDLNKINLLSIKIEGTKDRLVERKKVK